MVGSTQKTLGARVHADGVTFGVWAPFAQQVHVVGDFNDWSDIATPMRSGEDGCWYANVKDAAVGHKYQYVITYNATQLRRNDPRALAITKNEQHSVVVDPSFEWGEDSFKLPSPNELVIYELHVGTFYRSDTARPGTFDDVIEKLDYLAALGVNVIEIMPIAEFTTDGSWGYNPAYLYAIESSYGGLRAFQELVRAAHRRGIGVIVDVVYNHLGPGDLDIWQFDGWSENNKGGIYFYNDYRAATPWGDTRLDFGRPEVRNYLVDNVRMWMHDCHVDGLRFDSTHNIHRTKSFGEDGSVAIPEGWQFLQEATKAARKEHKGAVLVAEDLANNADITKSVSDGGLGFTAQWDTGLAYILREQLDTVKDEFRHLGPVADTLKMQFNANPFQRVIYDESHDADANGRARLPEEIAPGDEDNVIAQRRASLGAAIMLTAPGIPMLFQGQEFQEGGSFSDTNPLDWQKTQENAGMLLLFTDLISMRRNLFGCSSGLRGNGFSVLHQDDATKVLAYHRFDKGGPKDDVVVVANFANTQQLEYEISMPREGCWHVRFSSDWKGYNAQFTNTPTPPIQVENDGAKAKVNLGPYSCIILSQD